MSARFEWKLPIRNTSDSPATLVNLFGNCSCVSMKPLPLRIEPGTTAVLILELDLTNWCSAAPDDSQAYRINLAGVVRTAAGEHQVGWVLEGRAKHSLRPNPRLVDFGRVWAPSLPLERVIDLRPSSQVGPVRADIADDPTGGITAEVRPAPGDPTGGITAEVRPAPGGSRLHVRLNRVAVPGRYRCEVRLSPATPGGEPLPAVRLPVEWEVLGEIQPDTHFVDCGPRPVGSVSEQTVTLSSLADRPFRITGAESGRGGTKLE
ncbi:MAG TPA: hypothetical protein VH092_05250, partial [Urbifossiella sp.]|nr:hypothetical protein [Urbifossiella sp.]